MAQRDHARLALLLFIVAASLHPQEIAPRVAHRVEPEYTKEALDAKVEGDVILSLTIGTDGVPSDIKLVRGLGMGLDEKAVQCLRGWRFRPPRATANPFLKRQPWKLIFGCPNREVQSSRLRDCPFPLLSVLRPPEVSPLRSPAPSPRTVSAWWSLSSAAKSEGKFSSRRMRTG